MTPPWLLKHPNIQTLGCAGLASASLVVISKQYSHNPFNPPCLTLFWCPRNSLPPPVKIEVMAMAVLAQVAPQPPWLKFLQFNGMIRTQIHQQLDKRSEVLEKFWTSKKKSDTRSVDLKLLKTSDFRKFSEIQNFSEAQNLSQIFLEVQIFGQTIFRCSDFLSNCWCIWACTTCLISWCKANSEACILPADCGCHFSEWPQSEHQAVVYSIPGFVCQTDQKLIPIVCSSQLCHQFVSKFWLISWFRMWKKYGEANKTLGATGAGLTAEELKENPDMKKLLGMFCSCFLSSSVLNHISDKVLENFSWWEDFHGYWRMNLTYNTVYTTGNPGQYFEVEVLQHFSKPKSATKAG